MPEISFEKIINYLGDAIDELKKKVAQNATNADDGLMSAKDKAKLDGLVGLDESINSFCADTDAGSGKAGDWVRIGFTCPSGKKYNLCFYANADEKIRMYDSDYNLLWKYGT